MPKDSNLISSAWGGENLRSLTPEERRAGLKNISLSDDAFTLTGRLIGDTGEADIHRQTAAEIFGVEPEQVTSSQRVAARAINFGITYGSTNREGMTHNALRMESMIAGYRAAYRSGGKSDFSAIRATYELHRRFIESASDPDPLVQLERRLWWQNWLHLPIRSAFVSPVLAVALDGFEDV